MWKNQWYLQMQKIRIVKENNIENRKKIKLIVCRERNVENQRRKEINK